MTTTLFESLGQLEMSLYLQLKKFFHFLQQVIRALFTERLRYHETLVQIESIAFGSIIVIVFCVCFAAMVTLLEASYHMKLVIQNDSMVPGFASVLILRELGVVITALLLTSRVGAGMAAEVGTMKVTEQIDALRVLGINPYGFLVVPRLLASCFSTAVLSIIANLACLGCALLVSEKLLGYGPAVFLSGMRIFVDFQDLLLATLKGAVFGTAIPLICCYFGFHCQSGAEGVGQATTKSVVVTSVTIIVLDFLMSYAFTYLY